MSAKSVFISHASEDDAIVRDLRQALELLGIETWVDSERVTPGEALTETIQKSIENAHHLLLVASQDAMNSGWVEHEIEFAPVTRRSLRFGWGRAAR